MKNLKQFLSLLRKIWVVGGILTLAWLFYSFQAQGFDRTTILTSDDTIQVDQFDGYTSFTPRTEPSAVFFFLPGGMVDPVAYAPFARTLAANGIRTLIVELPWRTASLPGQEEALLQRVQTLMQESDPALPVVLGGHSRGAALSTMLLHQYDLPVESLILLGTTHPKDPDTDLSNRSLPIIKISASEDGVADPAAVERNRIYLPPHTRYVVIEGGNHAQFGWYGMQLGDGRATIRREEQQAQVTAAILEFLASIRKTP